MTLHLGDCRDIMPTLSGVTAIVTDPPYGLSFMGKGWDHGVPGREFWELALEAAVPGAPLLAFGGTRTYHRLACAIEDAGWQLRDCLMWVYGTGFPKSHDIGKAIDKDAAKTWDGYGTALKPAWEPIILAMKPCAGTFAANAVEHGVAGLNVDACRIPRASADTSGWSQSGSKASTNRALSGANYARDAKADHSGRWPANLIHDGSDEVLGPLGDASRFFYCAKASKAERGADNKHPTVKPLALMKYLLTLVTMPERNLVLDPFMGSGSTGVAAKALGLPFVGIEQAPDYMAIAEERVE